MVAEVPATLAATFWLFVASGYVQEALFFFFFCRQGHGRHLLTSLSSKLAILGPPRMVAEVPETFAPPASCSSHVAISRKRS